MPPSMRPTGLAQSRLRISLFILPNSCVKSGKAIGDVIFRPNASPVVFGANSIGSVSTLVGL